MPRTRKAAAKASTAEAPATAVPTASSVGVEKPATAALRRSRRQAPALPKSPVVGQRKRTTEHPGLVGKVTRRSKQEVAAEQAEKAAKIKAEVQRKLEAKERLAAMEIDSTVTERSRKKNVLRRQYAMLDVTASSDRKDLDKHHDSNGGDTDPVDTNTDDNQDDSDNISDGAATAKEDDIKKTHKPTKRALLNEVGQLKREIVKSKVATRKLDPTALPAATGFRDSWRKPTKTIKKDAEPVIGGLKDDDALSVQPNFDPKVGRRRKNDYVEYESDGKETETEAPPTKRAKQNRRHVSTRVETLAVPSSEESGTENKQTKIKQGAVPPGKPSRFKTTIVPKQGNNTNLVKAEAVTSNSTMVTTSTHLAQIRAAKRFRDLPSSFTNSTMIKQFRSTCYHGWMASDDLFDGFTIESDILLGIVRTVFSKVFPDSAYIPSVRDVFHQTIYDNIQTNRSNTAHHAIQAVTMFLSELSQDEVKDWVDWTRAVRLGELIYKEPCPPGSNIIKGTSNFVKPQGLLMTSFVIDLAKPYLHYMNSSLIDYGYPRGLVALILVALERAARTFETGVYKDPGQFSGNFHGSLIEYIRSVDTFTKWDNFYAVCDFALKKASKRRKSTLNMVETSQIDIGRRDLNFSSSE
ncbi:hypothetical protein M378DRAFT_16235 [Amanita muscaria Koide BX008]|uniref:Uncharacterized protein n=1 Tax=Amanita muscaria (strain Koide BX008) TaxID=946122 RepID=A0A0C2S443_AMAMK|nr:hypothetical protein M378DRAFT_16235 [Amanita muscaria Koide BX008]